MKPSNLFAALAFVFLVAGVVRAAGLAEYQRLALQNRPYRPLRLISCQYQLRLLKQVDRTGLQPWHIIEDGSDALTAAILKVCTDSK